MSGCGFQFLPTLQAQAAIRGHAIRAALNAFVMVDRDRHARGDAQVDSLGGRVRRQDVNLGELATVGDFDAKLGTARARRRSVESCR
jgi:hypothetical protein